MASIRYQKDAIGTECTNSCGLNACITLLMQLPFWSFEEIHAFAPDIGHQAVLSIRYSIFDSYYGLRLVSTVLRLDPQGPHTEYRTI